jgi:hypothetical protein
MPCAARQVTDCDVTLLLDSGWRPRVMGAWFASARAERLETALLRSLETSGGSLTAPPLAAVVVRELGAKAVPSFAAAVLERLGFVRADVAIDGRDHSDLDQMLVVARRPAEGNQPDSR